MMYLGIDFGTVWTKAAVYDTNSQQFVLVRMEDASNNESDYELIGDAYSCPTAVFYDKTNNRTLVGKSAVRSRNTDPENFYYMFKPYLSGKEAWSWEQCVVDLFKFVAEKAREQTNVKCFDNVILTVPSSTIEDDIRWNIMLSAAQKAGLGQNIELVKEPIAASYYILFELAGSDIIRDGDKFLVYDFGGGTFDPALVEVYNGALRVIGEWGNFRGKDIGGIYIDELIKNDIRDQNVFFQEQEYMLDLIPQDEFGRLQPNLDIASKMNYLNATENLEKMSQMAIKAKHYLSKEFKVPYRQKEIGCYDYELTFDDYEDMISTIIDDTIQCCNQIEYFGCFWKDLSKVFLIGGSSQIPLVKKRLEEKKKSENAVFKIYPGNEHDKKIDILHAVAIGAAVYKTMEPNKKERVEFGKCNLKRGDYAEAEYQFKKAESFFWQGIMAYTGLGRTFKSFREAIRLFQKSENPKAKYMLGRMYFFGEGVRKDDNKVTSLLPEEDNILKVIKGSATREEIESVYEPLSYLSVNAELADVLSNKLIPKYLKEANLSGKGITIYVKTPKWEHPSIFVWDDNHINGLYPWPGQYMTPVKILSEKWWMYGISIQSSFYSFNMVINDRSTQKQTVDILEIVNNGCYEILSETVESKNQVKLIV